MGVTVSDPEKPLPVGKGTSPLIVRRVGREGTFYGRGELSEKNRNLK